MNFNRRRDGWHRLEVLRCLGAVVTAAIVVVAAFGKASGDGRRARDFLVQRVTNPRGHCSDPLDCYDQRCSVGGISDDGRIVAFVTESKRLRKSPRTGVVEIYVQDTKRRRTRHVTAAVHGDSYAQHDDSFFGGLSADGGTLLFHSASDALVTEDGNRQLDVFAHDVVTGETWMVSADADGQPGNSYSYTNGQAPLSADGRWAVFSSTASNFIPGFDERFDYTQIYLADLEAATLTLVSTRGDGTVADGTCTAASISSNGRYVVYCSQAGNIVEGVNRGFQNIFLYDRILGMTSIIPTDLGSGDPDEGPCDPTVSNDGNRVGFLFYSVMTDEGNRLGRFQYFVADRERDEWFQIRAFPGADWSAENVYSGMLSSDGRVVVFESATPEIVPGDGSSRSDVFVFDIDTGVVDLVSASRNDEPLDASSYLSSGRTSSPLSHNGAWCVFSSNATGPGRRDRNGHISDIFKRRIREPENGEGVQ